MSGSGVFILSRFRFGFGDPPNGFFSFKRYFFLGDRNALQTREFFFPSARFWRGPSISFEGPVVFFVSSGLCNSERSFTEAGFFPLDWLELNMSRVFLGATPFFFHRGFFFLVPFFPILLRWSLLFPCFAYGGPPPVDGLFPHRPLADFSDKALPFFGDKASGLP